MASSHSAQGTAPVSNPVSLKVMRLCKPSFGAASTLVPWLPDELESCRPTFAIGGALALPQSFGNIYLGETFTAFVSVCNQSEQPLASFGLKVEVQTSKPLRPVLLNRPPKDSSSALAPQGRSDCIVKHELREVGVHILICTATYTAADGEARNLRKFFKFNVQNPLSMKSKSHSLYVGQHIDSVIVETQIQNVTSGPLYLSSISFLPGPDLVVEDLNAVAQRGGQLRCLNPGDVQQYMYQLRQAPSSDSGTLKAAFALGRMEVFWKGPMAESGHLQSNMVQRRPMGLRPVEVTVMRTVQQRGQGPEDVTSVTCSEPFMLKCRLVNATEQEQTLVVRSTQAVGGVAGGRSVADALGGAGKPASDVVFVGKSGQELGTIPPRGTVNVDWDFLPLTPGLQKVSGVALYDTRAGKLMDLGCLAEVLVVM